MMRGLALAFLFMTLSAQAGEIAPAERRSDTVTMSPELRAMQADDMANPASLWALDGQALWDAGAGSSGKSCADCHGDARASMKGVAARYPAFDAASGRVLDLEARINQCRADRQGAAPLARESRALLNLTTYVGQQSRGEPIRSDDPRLAPAIEKGRQLFSARQGQLNLSCAICHDDNWGRKLGSATVPQAHPTGYPIYRLEWQSVGSLQRRLRNCMVGMRAEPYAFGSDEFIALEAFLMSRAQGLRLETPAVRP
jgi:L-cysteine S-thiosulfotransferase